eukprot:10843310-Ditylum_brightwellii.AAC.1
MLLVTVAPLTTRVTIFVGNGSSVATVCSVRAEVSWKVVASLSAVQFSLAYVSSSSQGFSSSWWALTHDAFSGMQVETNICILHMISKSATRWALIPGAIVGEHTAKTAPLL